MKFYLHPHRSLHSNIEQNREIITVYRHDDRVSYKYHISSFDAEQYLLNIKASSAFIGWMYRNKNAIATDTPELFPDHKYIYFNILNIVIDDLKDAELTSVLCVGYVNNRLQFAPVSYLPTENFEQVGYVTNSACLRICVERPT